MRVPHDWAIYGPFDRSNDLQTVAVEQNGEKEETGLEYVYLPGVISTSVKWNWPRLLGPSLPRVASWPTV